MPDYRAKRPKITWGAAFANTLSIGYALDNVRTGREKRAGSSAQQAPSGIEDAWTVGIDYTITFDLCWIPRDATVTPLATGWDGATGVAAWLDAARDKGIFRFYPDASGGTYIECYLVEPMTGQGDLMPDQTRKLTLTLRNAATAFDGYGS